MEVCGRGRRRVIEEEAAGNRVKKNEEQKSD